jgi:hypothetical protein
MKNIVSALLAFILIGSIHPIKIQAQIISVKALDTTRPAQYFCVIGKLELTLISWDMR